MRIISGIFRGKKIQPPNGISARPTTDFAKESLFNLIQNRKEISELRILDLFSGTGNISFEFASRGCPEIWSIEKERKSYQFIRDTAQTLKMPIHAVCSDVFVYLRQYKDKPFDLIFADPPYTLSSLNQLPEIIWNSGVSDSDTLVILEHGRRTPIHHETVTETRNYGNVWFTFMESIKFNSQSSS